MIKKIDYKDTLPIRQTVLWPDLSLEELYVPGDENAVHYGYFINAQLVGVISVFIVNDEVQFRKFAVLPQYQNKGIGTKLLNHVFEMNSESTIWCNARLTATDLYKKFGMMQEPNSNYIKGGIEFIIMKKRFS